MTEPNAAEFAVALARLAKDMKCSDVVVCDLRGKSHLTDFILICTGTSDRQIRATSDRMEQYGRKVGEKAFGVSGYEHAAWIVVDFVDVVVHIFEESYRSYYDLELLWGDAPRLDIWLSESA